MPARIRVSITDATPKGSGVKQLGHGSHGLETFVADCTSFPTVDESPPCYRDRFMDCTLAAAIWNSLSACFSWVLVGLSAFVVTVFFVVASPDFSVVGATDGASATFSELSGAVQSTSLLGSGSEIFLMVETASLTISSVSASSTACSAWAPPPPEPVDTA